jgi:hypothetical protein
VEIIGEEGEQKLKLATFDPFNLVSRQVAAQELELPIEWCMASRKRLHEALRHTTTNRRHRDKLVKGPGEDPVG